MLHLTQMLMESKMSPHSEFMERPSHAGADHSSEDSRESLFLGLIPVNSQVLGF